jgi:hypothetical protein
MEFGDSKPEYDVSRPELEGQIFEYIDEGVDLIHIAGEPGVGKTWTIERAGRAYSDSKDIANVSIGGHFGVEDLYGIIYRSVLNNLPEERKEEGSRLTGVGGSAFGFGASASWDSKSADAPQVQFQYRDVLEDVAKLYPDDRHLLLFIDDIHKLRIEEDAIRDAIREVANLLTENITLITAGQLAFDRLDTAVTISTFSEEQTKSLLQDEFKDLAEKDATEIHRELDGHPLYIGLLIEANEPDETPEIPKGEVYDEIQTRYLHSLSEDEQLFLRLTSPLTELNERLCAAAIPDDESFDEVSIDRLLRGLSERVITQDLGWDDDGVKSYRIHDTFREFLQKRLNPEQETRIHRNTFQYYSKRIQPLLSTNEVDLHTEVELVFSCLDHLSEDIAGKEHRELGQLIESGFSENGLRYYPASLLAEEFRTWEAESIPDRIVDLLISTLDERAELARAFYSENTHSSWGEELLRRDWFNEPDGYLLGYLNQIVSDQPDFVLRVIRSTTTESPNTRFFFVQISTELPPEIAADTTSIVANWITTTENIYGFEYQALQLVEYLCEHGEIQAALETLVPILHPTEQEAQQDRQQNRRFNLYSTTETLDSTLDQFVAEAGEDFVRRLENTLRETLQSEEDETGTLHSELVAKHKPIKDLDYDKTHTNKRKHVIYTYLSRAAVRWIDDDPTDLARRQLIQDYLDDDNPNFRRLGLFLLSNHPEIDIDRTRTELLKGENYHRSDIQFEFYRLLEQGFQHLSSEIQEEVCQLIRNGPQDSQKVRQRAEYLADESGDSTDEIKQRIIEKWHRNRLYLVKDALPEGHREYLTDILSKYGQPERLPTEPITSYVHGRRIEQEEPDELSQIPGDSAEEVLQFVAEWEPSEEKEREQQEDDRFEEVSHHSLSSDLEERIREHPSEYVAEITLLKDAKPQYADMALHTLQDVLDDGQTFPWSPVLELSEHIAANPEGWSDRCRFDIVNLILNAIVSDVTDFPTGHIDRTKQLLLNLVAEIEIDTDDQPSSWIGGIGTSQGEVRGRAVDALVMFAVWQHDTKSEAKLDPEIGEMIRTKITSDTDLEVESALGRQFGNLWALDEELVKDGLEELFTTKDTLDAKRQFSRAFNGYLSRHNCHAPSYYSIRKYYIHAIDLVTEEETDQELVNREELAGHIGASYIFQDESLHDGNSLIRRYYDQSSPESAAEIANAISQTLENSSELDDKWNQIRELWRWRINQVEKNVQSLDREEKYRREFQSFFDCLKKTDEAGLPEEQKLIVRSVRFIIHNPHGVRSLEEWLANQSDEYPLDAITVYEQFVEAVSSDKWPEVVRSSQDEHRKKLYANAVEHEDSTGNIAIRIANQFAAQGEDYDRDFLDDQLGK